MVRHGETSWNLDGRYQGQMDVPLSPVGQLQAASLAEQVRLFPFAAGVATWWRTVGPKVTGLPNLSVVRIPNEPVQQLAETVERRVAVQVMVIEGEVTMTVGGVDATFTPEPLL